jgi:hypothetical protein
MHVAPKYDRIAFRHNVPDLEASRWDGRVQTGNHGLEAITIGDTHTRVRVTWRKQFVDCTNIAGTQNLGDESADDSLVLFGRHARSPPPPSLSGFNSIACELGRIIHDVVLVLLLPLPAPLTGLLLGYLAGPVSRELELEGGMKRIRY